LASAVPEPNGTTLALIASLGFLIRRRSRADGEMC
jgi:hypothetical protein